MQAYAPEPKPPPPTPKGRLDALLPQDSETGAVSEEAFHVYLSATLEMMHRTSNTFALILVSMDESPLLQMLGLEGAQSVRHTLAQYLRLESRVYDVVGRLSYEDAMAIPVFAVAAPISDEAQAVAFAVRVCEKMRYVRPGEDAPCIALSVGVAASTWTMETAQDVLDRAEFARQEARRQGGGRICSYSELGT
jgi:GGDEF domain-containing protein